MGLPPFGWDGFVADANDAAKALFDRRFNSEVQQRQHRRHGGIKRLRLIRPCQSSYGGNWVMTV